MATTTPNIGLTLPTGTEGWKRSVINGNFSILDTKIGAVGNTPLQTQINTLSSQIETYSFGQKASLSDFVTALNSYVSTLATNSVRNVVVEFLASSAPFSTARYIGVLTKTTNIRAQLTLHMHNGQQVIHGIQNEASWSWDGYAFSSQIMKYQGSRNWTSGANCNDYTTEGLYMLSDNLTNAPLTWFTLIVYAPRNDAVTQIAMKTHNAIYVRFYTSSWSAWKQIATTDFFTNYVDITATTTSSGSIALSNTSPSFSASAILFNAQISPEQSPTVDGMVLLVRSYGGNWYARVMNWDLTPIANTTVKIRVYGV